MFLNCLHQDERVWQTTIKKNELISVFLFSPGHLELVQIYSSLSLSSCHRAHASFARPLSRVSFCRKNESDNSINIDIDDEDEGEEISKDGRFSFYFLIEP